MAFFVCDKETEKQRKTSKGKHRQKNQEQASQGEPFPVSATEVALGMVSVYIYAVTCDHAYTQFAV